MIEKYARNWTKMVSLSADLVIPSQVQRKKLLKVVEVNSNLKHGMYKRILLKGFANNVQKNIRAMQDGWMARWTGLILYSISRVSDQNGIFLQWYIVEIYHSGQKPSICPSLRSNNKVFSMFSLCHRRQDHWHKTYQVDPHLFTYIKIISSC